MLHRSYRWVFSLLLFMVVILAHGAQAAPTISYRLSMPEPQTHYFEVEMRLNGFKGKTLDVKMPVWAPGSYLIREFAKNVESFAAESNGKAVATTKINKNTWRVSGGGKDLTIRYKVYAYELSVRTSFIDASHGYLNGTSVFMYPEGHKDLPSTLVVEPYKGWSKISTGLPSISGAPNTFRAENYDILADSPIEIGNHQVFTFDNNGVPHEVAMYGDGNYNPQQLVKDMKRITEEAVKVFGELPLNRYVFIVHNLERGGGGLEHLNSTSLQTSRMSYGTEVGYRGFLNLVAHEYFHLWNVKRLRPIALGPFNYDEENYTNMLWVSEGFTSYYADLLVTRAGYSSPQGYLDRLAASITSVENTPGTRIMSAAQSSFDAWIKQYRTNENSYNDQISYYSKGAILGMLLDMEILKGTKGAKSLDDAMRYLYETYYKQKGRGFTDKEFQQGVEKFAGHSLDEFFRKYVYGTEMPDYNTFLDAVGVKFTNVNANQNVPQLGAAISTSSGKPVVTIVTRNSSAWHSGLNVNDEIIAVNGYRIADDINKAIPSYSVGDELEFVISRGGQIMILPVKLRKDETLKFRAERIASPSEVQQKSYKTWLDAK